MIHVYATPHVHECCDGHKIVWDFAHPGCFARLLGSFLMRNSNVLDVCIGTWNGILRAKFGF